MALGTTGAPEPAWSHSFAPALLTLHERAPGVYDAWWRWTGPGAGLPRDLRPRIPEGCRRSRPALAGAARRAPAVRLLTRAGTERSSAASPGARGTGAASNAGLAAAAGLMRLDCRPGGLAGRALSVVGLDLRGIDAMVVIRTRRGRTLHATLRSDEDRFVVPGGRADGTVFWRYAQLGVRHILGGLDHLLFLLGLLLLVRGAGPLLRVITAFTLAHCATLALATLGVVDVPSAPVEALIALSIVVLAAELLRDGRQAPSVARRYPTLLCGCFGLLHGLGFAGGLREIGLPEDAVPAALVSFNIGVEVGQLLFVAAVLLCRPALARLRAGARAGLERAAPYALGGVGAAWFIDRCLGLWGR